MTRLYISLYIFFSLSFSADCFNVWYSKFRNDKDNDYIYEIYATFDNTAPHAQVKPEANASNVLL